jgi:fructan beta-fructosidase
MVFYRLMGRDNSEQTGGETLKKPVSRRDLTRTIGGGVFTTLLFGGGGDLLSMTGTVSGAKPESQSLQQWRPDYHFSPDSGWMNDPNGLVYQNGVYHLFYQAGEWPRRWDHATSTDLVNWTEHGTKIPATTSISPFSGGAVIDENNTTGFGTDALVCMYTGHHIESGVEDQRIAYSTDNGQTVHKYDGNPVIPSDVGDFRDPNPLWYEPDNSWRMVVGRISPSEGRPAGTEIYSSENLLDWTYESTYKSGDEAWECPDLFKLPVEGSAEMRWVLTVSPVETRTVEYHVGHFDGTEFTADEVVTADDGYDLYATQRWSNSPEDRGLNISWMNNWNYAMDTIVGWQEAMTIPRTTMLKEVEDSIEVRQYPADELTETRTETIAEMDSGTIAPSNNPLKRTDVTGRTLELVTTIDPHSADQVGIRVREGDDQESVIVYDAVTKELRFDRTNSGKVFHDDYYGTTSVPLEPLDDDTITLRVLVERCSVEIFANEGRQTMTNLVFPDWDSTDVSLFAEGGAAKIDHLIAYDLER